MPPSLLTPPPTLGTQRGQPASSLPPTPHPPVPSPRLGGVSVPLPGRHMWFQLAAERAFPSQTAGPCQGLGPTGAHRKGHLDPRSSTGHPGDPRGPSPLEDPALLSHGLPLTWIQNPHRLVQAPAMPGAPATTARLRPRSRSVTEQAERDGRRAGCQGGGREGGEGACGNETLITEPLLFPSIWDISYILKTLAVYIFKGSG